MLLYKGSRGFLYQKRLNCCLPEPNLLANLFVYARRVPSTGMSIKIVLSLLALSGLAGIVLGYVLRLLIALGQRGSLEL
ncbi:MAG: hypothetical protein Q8O19_06710, partial [Rectinemataceae bacterium]|nr:hypothetical protein [Rectinemataceae bacterium]